MNEGGGGDGVVAAVYEKYFWKERKTQSEIFIAVHLT